MDISNTICRIYNLSPFELFKQDSEEVIMLLNYLIEKSLDNQSSQGFNSSNQKEQRIKVNDKTATGGWF